MEVGDPVGVNHRNIIPMEGTERPGYSQRFLAYLLFEVVIL